MQQEKLGLPILPTTTIGSFPQSPEVRRTRLAWKRGNISDVEYEDFIKSEIARWIQIQEDLDIDVLVHGEFERVDMVEFFGQKLAGFTTTKLGWVQSYGSRAVKPPIIYGDVKHIQPLTVQETVYAQSLTDRPVKGMLTGPITITNWSFERSDISRADLFNQIGLAIKDEIKLLEDAGIAIIQVDEAALREGLPLRKSKQQAYLDDAVHAFHVATSSVKEETQIHTHMCYSKFNEIIDSIRALDADVISIETSRSHGDVIESFETAVYPLGIGLGVYDIHSPRVPTKEEVIANIERPLRQLSLEQFWVNPDCGLKTRREPETVAALEVLVAAARKSELNTENKKGYAMSRLLERLKTDILVADGAMGTLLYANGLDNCYEAYNLTHPDKISAIHHAYLEAGADTIQTNTYAAKRHRLKGYAYDDQVKEINQAGVKIAREAAGDDAFVLGTVGALRGLKQCNLTLDEIIEETLEQVGYLIETNQLMVCFLKLIMMKKKLSKF